MLPCPQLLLNKHKQENAALIHSQDAEQCQAMQAWDAKLAGLSQQTCEQEAELLNRHSNELQAFHLAADASVPRPRWSSALLNTRRIEEVLVRQHELQKAAIVKADADAREVEEALRKEDEHWMKVGSKKTVALHPAALQNLHTRSVMHWGGRLR